MAGRGERAAEQVGSRARASQYGFINLEPKPQPWTLNPEEALNRELLRAQMIFATGRSGSPRHFRRVCDKKVNALGMTALLGVPDQALPPELAAGLPQLMAGLIKLLIALKTQQARVPVLCCDSRSD